MANDRIYRNACKVYDAMLKDASEDGTWVGYLTGWYKRQGFQQGYYSATFKALKETGCITVSRRGGGPTKTVIHLLHPPIEESWPAQEPGQRSTTASAQDIENQIVGLKRLVGGVSVPDALGEVEARLVEIEQRLDIKRKPR